MATTLNMPIIAPPQTIASRDTYYSQIAAQTSVQVTAVPSEGLKIKVSNTAYFTLYAMTEGYLSFIPLNQPLFPGSTELNPYQGGYRLQVGPNAYSQLKNILGLPTVKEILYLNVDPATVRAALQPLVSALPLGELQRAWTQGTTQTDRTILTNNYLDAVLAGQKAVYVPAGTALGKLSTAGEFILRMRGLGTTNVSPLHHLKNMAATTSVGGPLWQGHPLGAAVASFSLPVDIYVKFEVWDLTQRAFKALPQGVSVSLMDYDPASSNDTLATALTDANGTAHFYFATMAALLNNDPDDTATPDLFFIAHTAGRQHAGHTLPAEWSTRGWQDAAGLSTGYFNDFAGGTIGQADAPLVFRIGLDYHLQLEYRNERTGGVEPAVKGIPVKVCASPSNTISHTTDGNGQVHGVTFSIPTDSDVYFEIRYECVADTAIKLQAATIEWAQGFWTTLTADADRTVTSYYPDLVRTSIGTQTAPARLTATAEKRNVVFYMLKILREWSTFLYHMTGGQWTGVSGLVIDIAPVGEIFDATSSSWPIGTVNLVSDDHWDRETIIHELSHQILWKEANYNSVSIPYNVKFSHWENLLHTPEHALIEGWAEFMEAVFEGRTSPPFTLDPIRDVDRNPVPKGLLDLPLDGRGERVEGAFATGLFNIFWRIVTAGATFSPLTYGSLLRHPTVPPNAPAPLVPETPGHGDVTKTAPWLTNTAIRDRFIQIIWEPLKALAPITGPQTTDMLDAMRLNTIAPRPEYCHRILTELQRYNMAIEPPRADWVSPTYGPAAGGQTLAIGGNHFSSNARVTIGGKPATVTVTNSRTISVVTPPGTVGAVADVVVTTDAGSSTRVGGYVYQ